METGAKTSRLLIGSEWRETGRTNGLKDSGSGREEVRFAMEEMTEIKSLILNNS